MRTRLKEPFSTAAARVRRLIVKADGRKDEEILNALIDAYMHKDQATVRSMLAVALHLIGQQTSRGAMAVDLALYRMLIGIAAAHGVALSREQSYEWMEEEACIAFATVTEAVRLDYKEEPAPLVNMSYGTLHRLEKALEELGVGGRWSVSVDTGFRFTLSCDCHSGWLAPPIPFTFVVNSLKAECLYMSGFGYGTREELIAMIIARKQSRKAMLLRYTAEMEKIYREDDKDDLRLVKLRYKP